MFQSVNPTTGVLLAEYEQHSTAQWRARVERAGKEFRTWRECPLTERTALLKKLGELLRKRSGELSRLMTLEMGKRISESRAEVEKCAGCADFYAAHAAEYLANEYVTSSAHSSYIRFDPLGVILGVMPWNFPLWQVLRFAIPTLAAGNVVVFKHASNVMGTALALEQLFEDSGFLPNTVQALLVPGGSVADVIRRDEIAAVSLTGSEGAGRAVAQVAGSELKKCVLELGGSDPFIVLADADISSVVDQAVSARLINAGQSCIAAKRFIVERPIYGKFLEAFAAKMSGLKLGDPLLEETELGPLARRDLLDDLDRQVRESVAAGAKLITGGHRVSNSGFFYEATVIEVESPSNVAFREETFGPVAAVMQADSAQEAIAIANASSFGLGASLWTKDIERAERIAREIESGMVFINTRVASDVHLPFGGIKSSGYGRELGELGIREFVNQKTVFIS